MEIQEKDFRVKRTPRELCDYVWGVESRVRSDAALFERANRREGPYERFLKELRPFAHYCRLKHGLESKVLCYLADTQAGDAYIEDPKTGQTHLVELTWPLDGQRLAREKKLLAKRGYGEILVFDYYDVSPQKAELNRVLRIAEKKALRDYSNPGGATLLFVFDKTDLFWDDNKRHRAILGLLVRKLGQISFHANRVEVLFLTGARAEIVPIHPKESDAVSNSNGGHF